MKIYGYSIASYSYNEYTQQITFYSEDGFGICDIQMPAEQWEAIEGSPDEWEILARLFGDE